MRRLLLVAAVLGAASCAKEPTRVVIAMRTSADRAHLVRGFSGFEGVGSPHPFAWIEAMDAKVSLGHLAREGTAELSIEAWPCAPPGLPPQRMKVWLNSAVLAEWTMEAERRVYAVRFPARLLSRADDDLYLFFDRTTRPRDFIPGSGDGRTLAAAVRLIEVRVGVSESR